MLLARLALAACLLAVARGQGLPDSPDTSPSPSPSSDDDRARVHCASNCFSCRYDGDCDVCNRGYTLERGWATNR